MNKKKFVTTVFVVVLMIATLNVVSIVKDMNDLSYSSYAMGSSCTTQGAFTPEPYQVLVVSSEVTETNNEILCSAQGGTKPPPWDDEDTDDTSGK